MNYIPSKEEIERNREIWIDALRSDKYTQGTQLLCDDDGNLCCLGVAAVTLSNTYQTDITKFTLNECRLNRLALNLLGLTPDSEDKLVNCNDELFCDFETIADILEEDSLNDIDDKFNDWLDYPINPEINEELNNSL